MESVWEVERDRGWGVGVGSEYCERKKNPDMTNRRDSRSRSDSAPAAGRGRERERRGVEPLPSAQAWNWRCLTLPPPPPLYSVLSSRCQEVAQCLFCFLLKVCVILHISFCLFVCFHPQELEEQTGSQKVSGSFVCFILSPVT